jgi:hypothetical protein
MRGACTRDDKFTSDISSNLCSCNTLTTNQSWALYLQLPSWIPTRDVELRRSWDKDGVMAGWCSCQTTPSNRSLTWSVSSPAKVVQLKVSVRLPALCGAKVNPLLEGPCCHIFPKSVLFSSSAYCVLIIMVTRGISMHMITCSHSCISFLL